MPRMLVANHPNNHQGGAMNTFTLAEMVDGLLHPDAQSRAAKSVEAFGWIMLAESLAVLLVPRVVAAVLQLDPLSEQSATYFRIGGMLIGGLGMLYVISGRLNSNGFIFASMIDRPLVPPMMLLLWSLGVVPGTLAVAFSILDFGTFLWTLFAWRADVADLQRVAVKAS
jgi:hypothetical protein